MHDSVYTRELAVSNKENGYCDIMASIDLSTFRRIPWENNVPFFLVSFFDPKTSAPICADPRGVLRKAIDNAAAHDLECISGVEFEVSNLSRLCVTLNGLMRLSSTLISKVRS